MLYFEMYEKVLEMNKILVKIFRNKNSPVEKQS